MKETMLNNKGFDHWSGAYDEDILRMQNEGYPFEGYYHTLGHIQNKVLDCNAKHVLDIGIGTGLLSEVLYNKGMQITGVDFSEKMLAKARQKMPHGSFIQFDFNAGLPEELRELNFDCIISSYAIHHINDRQKVAFLSRLIHHLNPKGWILIGDVAFESQQAMQDVKSKSAGWDESEYYMLADQIIAALAEISIKAAFEKTSSCSGVLSIQGN
jgi:putative AdoMet-dependent methyltransferase